MVSISLEAEHYDLQRSLEPSFLSSLYENPARGRWIKIAGKLNGVRVEQDGKLLKASYSGRIDRSKLKELTLLETGLWHEAFESRISEAPRSFRPILEALASEYPGVRIPIAPHDLQHLFLSILLSKRADYRLVRGWCAAIWKAVDDDLERLMSLSVKELEKITRSYQLYYALKSIRSAVELFGSLRSLHERVLRMRPEVARAMLMRVWGVGHKVADSLILSAFKATRFAPCDTHLVKLIKALRPIREFRLPDEKLCMRYACSDEPVEGLPSCPQYRQCLRGKLSSSLGELAGWFQTLAYIHGRLYCRKVKPRCSRCPLRSLCSSYS